MRDWLFIVLGLILAAGIVAWLVVGPCQSPTHGHRERLDGAERTPLRPGRGISFTDNARVC
jgi:hypothetical protein